MTLELRQLETFCVLAEEKHFGRTAARLYLAQSSVSQQLQRLERELGVTLVRRSSRRVTLTPAGELFVDEARAVLQRLANAAQAVRHLAGTPEGSLYVGTNFPASRRFLPALLTHLRATAPGLTVAVRELGSLDQEDALVRGDLHLGLVYGPPRDERLSSSLIGTVRVVAMMRPSHPLAVDDVLDLRRVSRYEVLQQERGSGRLLTDRVSTAAQQVGGRLGAQRETSSNAYLDLATSDAIAFASQLRGEQAEASGLVTRVLDPAPKPLELHVAWHPDRDHDVWVNAARTFLVSHTGAAVTLPRPAAIDRPR